jgi:predicted Zn-dependent peptidase
MTLLDAVLTGGNSSRLQLDLVKGQKSVIEFEASLGWPFASEDDYRDPGDYAAFLVFKPNFQPQQIVDQYQNEIAKIQQDGVSADDLHRAKMLLLDAQLRRLQTTLGRADLLANFELMDGRPQAINSLLDRYNAVTAEQVKAVANKYLKPSERVVLSIAPDPNAAKAAASAGGQK